MARRLHKHRFIPGTIVGHGGDFVMDVTVVGMEKSGDPLIEKIPGWRMPPRGLFSANFPEWNRLFVVPRLTEKERQRVGSYRTLPPWLRRRQEALTDALNAALAQQRVVRRQREEQGPRALRLRD